MAFLRPFLFTSGKLLEHFRREKKKIVIMEKKKEKANFLKSVTIIPSSMVLKEDSASCSDQKPVLDTVNKKLEVLSSTPYTSIDIILFYWNF